MIVTPNQRPQAGWPQAVDPRAKIAWFGTIFLLAIVLWNPIVLASLWAITLWYVYASRALRRWLVAIKAISWLIVIVTVADVLFYGPVVGPAAGLKFLTAVSAFAAIFITTPLDDISHGLVGLGLPYSFSFVLTAGASSVPTVAREAGRILDAYRTRGFDVERSPITRVRAYLATLVPLIVVTIIRSLHLAEAMEARGFGFTAQRTMARSLKMRPLDWLIVAGSPVLLVSAVAIELLLR